MPPRKLPRFSFKPHDASPVRAFTLPGPGVVGGVPLSPPCLVSDLPLQAPFSSIPPLRSEPLSGSLLWRRDGGALAPVLSPANRRFVGVALRAVVALGAAEEVPGVLYDRREDGVCQRTSERAIPRFLPNVNLGRFWQGVF